MSLLRTRQLDASYGDFQALFGIDMSVAEGETVAIIGSNGAGKSTFLCSLAGLLPNAPDAVQFAGTAIGAMAAHEIVHRGLALVPEGRRLFPSLSVEENLLLGAWNKRPGRWNKEEIYRLFPVLRERRKHSGTAMSGGQQQMLAIGRALMSNPVLLLCDEISLGLAPTIVRDIYAALETVRGDGTTVMIVEQDIGQALKVCDRFYCFQEGRVSLTGKPADVSREEIKTAYFGI